MKALMLLAFPDPIVDSNELFLPVLLGSYHHQFRLYLLAHIITVWYKGLE